MISVGFLASNVKTRPAYPAGAAPFMETFTPNSVSKLVMVAMSAKWGRFDKLRGWSLNKHAAIKGNAAFLAPPMWMVPCKDFPPRILIWSIKYPLNYEVCQPVHWGLLANAPQGLKPLSANDKWYRVISDAMYMDYGMETFNRVLIVGGIGFAYWVLTVACPNLRFSPS